MEKQVFIMKCSVVITKEENWYVAKDINSSVASQGKTIEDALDNLKEAITLYYEDQEKPENNVVMFTTMEVNV